MTVMSMRYIYLMFCVLSVAGCMNDCAGTLEEIHISSPARNTLRIQIDAKTAEAANAYVRYWPKGGKNQASLSLTSENHTTHKMLLTRLAPDRAYEFQVVTGNGKCVSESKVYNFSTGEFPVWMKDVFSVMCPDSSVLPAVFKQGYLMTYSKDIPGIVFFLDASGRIMWYHQVNGTGFKMAHFTSKGTIISLLGTAAYPTSYGNEILEISLRGDTLFHLKKGDKDLKKTIHHEVILDANDHVVAVTSEDSVFDLSAVGGGKADTVRGDGIIVLDKQGKKLWQWTVFDVMNPMSDKDILQQKKDWMHANSLCIDSSGNYLISFYNTGQIWKIDGKSGKLIWRFGKGGDFALPANGHFDQSHAIHLTKNNNLMFFDNGVSRKLSRAFIFNLNEQNRTASVVSNTPLPEAVYNDRMGSSYLVADTTILHSCSKKNTIVLTDLEGNLLWGLGTRFSPYRAEFVPAYRVGNYFTN